MMKSIAHIFLIIFQFSLAQIPGNKEIITKEFNLNQIETIKIHLYGEVIIDQSLEEKITITTDSNLFDLIEKEVINGVLYIDQKEWIKPSQKPKLIIGAPNLKAVEQGTHDTTKVMNLSTNLIRLQALVGTIIAEGTANTINIGVEVGKIDASKLTAENAYINIWGWGSAIINAKNVLGSKLDDNAKLTIVNTPHIIKGDAKDINNKESKEKTTKKIEYIKFKIQNNSSNRNNFFVIGPKPDGTTFGYGFPMMPNAIRKENWTTGTKVYKVNSLGIRRLLITIKKDDENTTVNLF